MTKVEAEVADKFLAAALVCHDKAVELSPKEAEVYIARASCRTSAALWGKLIHTILHPETPPLAVNSTEVLNDLYYAARLAPDNIQVVGTAAAMVLMSFNNDAHVAMPLAADPLRQLPQDLEERIVPMFRLLEDAARCPDSCRASDASGILGYLFFLKGNQDKAIVHYSRAVELDPNRDVAWDMLAWIVAATKDKESLIRVCERRISVHPTARGYFLLAKSYLGAARFDSAETAMRTGAKLAPLDYNTAMGLAVLLLNRADSKDVLAEAHEQYKKSVKLLNIEVAAPSQRAEMLVVGGVLAAQSGDMEHAAQLVREAVELDRNMYTLNIMTLLISR